MERKRACELCGKNTVVFKADVEGTELEICKDCGSFGKMSRPYSRSAPTKTPSQQPKEEEEPKERIAHNYAELIKKGREQHTMTQEELAKKLNEKESIIHKMETSALPPSIEFARKLEKLLVIRLVEGQKAEVVAEKRQGSTVMTIGDMIKKK